LTFQNQNILQMQLVSYLQLSLVKVQLIKGGE